MSNFSPREREVLEAACKLISPERALAMQQLLNWKHGGCLSVRQRPAIPDVTAEEDAAIRAVWDAIPDGSSSWMTAFFRILNARRT